MTKATGTRYRVPPRPLVGEDPFVCRLKPLIRIGVSQRRHGVLT